MFHICSEVFIPEGKLEGFKAAYSEALAKMEKAEPGTHSYMIHISEDGTKCQVDQYYFSEADFIAHLKASGPMLQEVLDAYKTDVRYWIFSRIESAEVKEIIPKIANLDLLVVGPPFRGYTREASGVPATWLDSD